MSDMDVFMPVSNRKRKENRQHDCDLMLGSLSIVGVGFVKIPPQFYEKGPFYV